MTVLDMRTARRVQPVELLFGTYRRQVLSLLIKYASSSHGDHGFKQPDGGLREAPWG